MGILKQQAQARATVAAALIEDMPMSKKVATAVALVAELNGGSRVQSKVVSAPLVYGKGQYRVVLTVDATGKFEYDDDTYGAVEDQEIAYPSDWQRTLEAWQEAYEEEGRWIA